MTAAAVSLAMVGGAGVATASADILEGTYVNGQFQVHNVGGGSLTITDVQWVDQGDMLEQYHWNFGCLSGALETGDSCIIWVEGTHGVIAVTTVEAGEQDVTLSDGS